MAELQDEVSDPTSQGCVLRINHSNCWQLTRSYRKVDEEEILEAARRFINSTNRLRSSALDTASRLQDIAEYLTQSVNAGTLLLRDNYDSDVKTASNLHISMTLTRITESRQVRGFC